MNTLLIPFSAHQVNISPSLHVTGMVSANAITGFGHALCRLIWDMFEVKAIDKGTALAIDTYTYHPGRQKNINAEKKEADKAVKGVGASTTDNRMGYLKGWVLLRFECSLAGLDLVREHITELEDQINRLRFAGGTMDIVQGARLFEGDSGMKSLSALPEHARIIEDVTVDLFRYADSSGIDYFQAMNELLMMSQRPDVDEGAEDQASGSEESEDFEVDSSEGQWEMPDTLEDIGVDSEDMSIGWMPSLFAMDIGYRAIEMPRARLARGLYLHAYAEPVIGLARIRMVAGLIRSPSIQSVFWVHRANHPYYLSHGATPVE